MILRNTSTKRESRCQIRGKGRVDRTPAYPGITPNHPLIPLRYSLLLFRTTPSLQRYSFINIVGFLILLNFSVLSCEQPNRDMDLYVTAGRHLLERTDRAPKPEVAEALFLAALDEAIIDRKVLTSEKKVRYVDDVIPIGKAFRALGNFYAVRCQHNKAESNLKRSVYVFEKSDRGARHLEGAYYDLAHTYYLQRQYGEADRYLTLAYNASGSNKTIEEQYPLTGDIRNRKPATDFDDYCSKKEQDRNAKTAGGERTD